MGNDIWALFAPGIVDYVDTVLRVGRVGICAGTLRILDVSSSCSSLTKGPWCDRFKLVIPYAGNSVTWEILFNCHHPDEPPDFIFGPEDQAFLPEIKDIKPLVDWDWEDPQSLLLVIQELLLSYKRYQTSLIGNTSRLQFEYNSLLEHSDYSPDDIEVHVTQKGQHRLGPVNFLIKLPINFARIPAYLTKDNPGEDRAVLLVTFQNGDGGKVTPQLFLSPRVEYTLGGSANMRIPAFPSGGCLIDYMPSVCELLNNKVEQVVHCYEKKREYVGAFLSHFGRSVVEYDTEGFTSVSFLMEWHDFFFTVIIDLPLNFPTEQPQLTFQSVYHESSDHFPFSMVSNDYPYSPRWSGNEMAERTRAHILEFVGNFQRTSVKDGSLRDS